MNDHERERIAAAMNQLRPDWPRKQLLTLLTNPQLADRPRRDVTVALAWVACESGTASPFRVLEAGPWWKSAAVDGTTSSNRDNPPKHERCSVCSLSHDRCRQVWADDHQYEPATVDRKRPAAAIAAIVQEAKGRIEPTAERPEPRAKPATTDPRITAARQALTTTAATEETTDA
jgi:hypothetical protein